MKPKTFIIAEPGCTWNYGIRQGQLAMGLRMIEIAAEAKCSAVKFQWVSDGERMAERRNVPGNPYLKLSWPLSWHILFRDQAHQLGLEYLCSVYLPEDVKTLSEYVDGLKVASLESRNRALLDEVERRATQKFVSFGATNWTNEIDNLAAELVSAGWQTLHCVASYPAQPEEMNLSVFHGGGDRLFDGLSDHTGDVRTGLAAVMCGATVIEVHYRQDGTPKDNDDYPHSHSPANLKKYVENVRFGERLLGEPVKKVMPGEAALVPHRVKAGAR